MPRVAVVVPVYRPQLSPDEKTSLAALRRFLGDHDLLQLSPEGLDLRLERFQPLTFEDAAFRSTATYSRLLLSRRFYEALADFDFALVYQLDALVFSDRIGDWSSKGYDYLGAPWLRDPEDPSRGFSRVGNGGFSLRRVAACRAVLRSPRLPPWRLVFRSAAFPDLEDLPPSASWRKRLEILAEARRGVTWYTDHYTLNEDRFWSDRARLFARGFTVAPVSEGLAFAFERAPSCCFEANGRRLPFGCHGWATHDRAFWEPVLADRLTR